MASSSSSLQDTNTNYTITQEEFNLFHTIDRSLFSRMVFSLGREPEESVRVMGFWLWLEKYGEESNLVHKMLGLPDVLVDALCDEAVISLACIQNDKFPFEPDSTLDIPLIQHVSKTPVSLRFVHHNRLEILPGVAKMCNDICRRAFLDILQTLHTRRAISRAPAAVSIPAVQGEGGGRGRVFEGAPPVTNFFVPSFGFLGLGGECSTAAIRSGMSSLELKSGKEEQEGEVVPADQRTIFLTFSKGYPISEDEVRDYFGRRYGNFIESIHMQEAHPPEQPLYARLVVKTESSIDLVLEARTKAKFSINGKHVWARKYVRKTPIRSSPRPPPHRHLRHLV
ncbi:uncharacterized protein LOC101221230 [Cucumis sativus]|uniref:RRM domain-containing protein n=1 Tax=Cucumis sativus TaxID=3659 RepID=A0A0A0KU25_CUCSA|nr:uncharacterized protein LOC101221230 [Cucumis sativus]KGN51236.1 hypothetical protein Csa_008375 [Cucumis sativus]